MRFFIAGLLFLVSASGAEDARELVRRSVHYDSKNWELSRDYTYQQRVETKEFGSDGKVKKSESSTFDITILYGQPYRNLIQHDDKPLTPEEEKKASDKLAKLSAERARETPAQRERRMEDYRRSREKERAFAKEIPEAFNFRIAGTETIAGREVLRVEAEPRPEFRPQQSMAKVLSKFRATFWIDTKEFQWVKLEAEAIDTVWFGLLLAKINKGARFSFEQTRVNDEVWLPKEIHATLDARIALFKHLNADTRITYGNYRKFTTDSNVVSTSQIR